MPKKSLNDMKKIAVIIAMLTFAKSVSAQQQFTTDNKNTPLAETKDKSIKQNTGPDSSTVSYLEMLQKQDPEEVLWQGFLATQKSSEKLKQDFKKNYWNSYPGLYDKFKETADDIVHKTGNKRLPNNFKEVTEIVDHARVEELKKLMDTPIRDMISAQQGSLSFVRQGQSSHLSPINYYNMITTR